MHQTGLSRPFRALIAILAQGVTTFHAAINHGLLRRKTHHTGRLRAASLYRYTAQHDTSSRRRGFALDFTSSVFQRSRACAASTLVFNFEVPIPGAGASAGAVCESSQTTRNVTPVPPHHGRSRLPVIQVTTADAKFLQFYQPFIFDARHFNRRHIWSGVETVRSIAAKVFFSADVQDHRTPAVMVTSCTSGGRQRVCWLRTLREGRTILLNNAFSHDYTSSIQRATISPISQRAMG